MLAERPRGLMSRAARTGASRQTAGKSCATVTRMTTPSATERAPFVPGAAATQQNLGEQWRSMVLSPDAQLFAGGVALELTLVSAALLISRSPGMMLAGGATATFGVLILGAGILAEPLNWNARHLHALSLVGAGLCLLGSLGIRQKHQAQGAGRAKALERMGAQQVSFSAQRATQTVTLKTYSSSERQAARDRLGIGPRQADAAPQQADVATSLAASTRPAIKPAATTTGAPDAALPVTTPMASVIPTHTAQTPEVTKADKISVEKSINEAKVSIERSLQVRNQAEQELKRAREAKEALERRMAERPMKAPSLQADWSVQAMSAGWDQRKEDHVSQDGSRKA